MVVAIACVDDDKDWPHARLERWARWARCAVPGAFGTAESYTRERLDQAHDGEPTPEIAVTDKAVAQMRVDRKDYWRVLAHYYMGHLAEWEIALELGRNMTFERVTAQLRQARMLVGYHIRKLESA